MNEAHPFRHWVQLEQPRLGTRVTYATDDFFAAKERVIDAGAPVFIDNKYDDHGKWMDGWESRRKRNQGHDFCVIRLGVPGAIRGFDIDTSHFTGNYPPQASIEACASDEETPEEGWVELLGVTDLSGDSHHFLEVSDERIWTHVRLHIYPDGGIARLRIFGEVRANFDGVDGFVDFAAIENGGRAIACSDEHYGSMHNLNVPGRGINMGDGWETARRRGPGNDWVIVALAQPGVVERVEVDTAHFKATTRTGCLWRRACLRATRSQHRIQVTGARCCRRRNSRWTNNIISRRSKRLARFRISVCPSIPTAVLAACVCLAALVGARNDNYFAARVADA